jgi:hypothetical protein
MALSPMSGESPVVSKSSTTRESAQVCVMFKLPVWCEQGILTNKGVLTEDVFTLVSDLSKHLQL